MSRRLGYLALFVAGGCTVASRVVGTAVPETVTVRGVSAVALVTTLLLGAAVVFGVDLDVRERPTVNVSQQASWVELRVRYLADPRRMQPTRNELYERTLAALNEKPDRVKFPTGRMR